ncbi:hypothetical protein LQF12_11210 [Ruania suaedae]|uniref:hypothetical protein n=1 Tax=Ruania suaedae TaxID=2897774 RepID=UPI001E3754BE|nr:hypothetical protein [Ruania suaedae]UFU02079.1 hypothetical protein LQF12_11210 [Ruania suaedae]
MRRGAVLIALTVAVLATGACTSEPSGPAVPPTAAPPTATPTTAAPEPEPEPFDPRSIDLADAVWTAADVWHEPETVQLVDGEATGERAGPGRYLTDVEEVLYVDLDGDEHQDVLAPLTFEAETSGEDEPSASTSWFAWLNDGERLTQYPFPVATSGECSTQVRQISPALSGIGVRITEAQMPWQSGCADGATIEVTRMVRIERDDAGTPWLVQTDPFPSWGGACLPMSGPGENPDEVSVAPGLEAASPEVPPVIVATGLEDETSDGSWMSASVEGWDFVTYVQDQDPDFVSHCGWTPER